MSNFQSILAIDTAMNGCSACVFAPGEFFTESRPMISGQSEHLMPMAGRVLEKAGKEYADLDAVVVTVGPGAFTGLRIGLSAARSLGLALDIPVYGITTLQVLAIQYLKNTDSKTPLVVLVETKREDFYFQMFDAKGSPLSEPKAAGAAEIAAQMQGREVTFIGDATARFRKEVGQEGWLFEEGLTLPDTVQMASILAVEGPGSLYLAADTTPIYLRAPDVSVSKKKQRTLAE